MEITFFSWIWLTSIISSFGIVYLEATKVFKALQDRGNKLTKNMSSIALNQIKTTNQMLSFFIPIYNIFFSMQYIKKISNVDQMETLLRAQGILKRKSTLDKPKKPNQITKQSASKKEQELHIISKTGEESVIVYEMIGDVPVIISSEGPISSQSRLTQRATLIKQMQKFDNKNFYLEHNQTPKKQDNKNIMDINQIQDIDTLKSLRETIKSPEETEIKPKEKTKNIKRV